MLTEHTELSKLKQSGARRVNLFRDVEGEATEDVTENAATEEAFDVLIVAEVFLERLPPTWGFFGLRDVIAFEIFADETPEAASDWVGR